MKLTIERKALKDAVDKAAIFVPKNTALTQLENIRISANGKLQLEATDLEAFIRVVIPNKADEDGTAMFPAKLLQDAVTRSTAKMLSIDAAEPGEGERFSIGKLTGEKSAVSMSLEKASFPEIEKAAPADATRFVIGGDMLQLIARKTVAFASTDEMRPSMQGILFKYDDGTLTVYSTDGHRMIRLAIPFAGGEVPFEFLIPAKLLAKLGRVLGAIIHVAVAEQFVYFQDGQVSVQVRQIDEKYPNIEAVIPRDEGTALIADKKLFAAALESVLVWANRNTTQVVCEFEQGHVRLIAQQYEYGTEASEMLAVGFEAEKFTVGFNGKFLRESIAALDGEEIRAKLFAPTRAVVIEEITNGMQVLILAMPVRLDGYVPNDVADTVQRLNTAAKAEAERRAAELKAKDAERPEADDDEDTDEDSDDEADEDPDDDSDDEDPDDDSDDEEADDDPDDYDEDTDSDDIIGA